MKLYRVCGADFKESSASTYLPTVAYVASIKEAKTIAKTFACWRVSQMDVPDRVSSEMWQDLLNGDLLRGVKDGLVPRDYVCWIMDVASSAGGGSHGTG